jgi:4-amino-4-deoxy-L-arabinose transferase-like glycosyltransferase
MSSDPPDRAPDTPDGVTTAVGVPSRALTGLHAALLGFLAVTLLVPAVRAGLWDPHEIQAIEFGRRIAVGLYGGAELALSEVANAVPFRGEVGRGELPFTSIGLGLRLFGLHIWAARLALVVWSFVGLAATYLLVRRLVDRSAALLAVLVLGTTPLYFLHSRTLLGDIVTMASLALATAGLALASFDACSPRLRSGWLVLGLLGLLSGLLSRGVLLGVAVPALGVGLSRLFLRTSAAVPAERARDAAGGLALLVGVVASLLGGFVLGRAVAEPDRYQPLLGFTVLGSAPAVTFDAVIGQLGHALFPWSAVVPVALARLTLPPPVLTDDARSREAGLRLAVVLVAALGVGAFTYLAPVAGLLPFGGVAALAVAVALFFRDLDRGAPPSPTLGIVVGALVLLFAIDIVNDSAKSLVAFGVEGLRFPETFKRTTNVAFVGAALVTGVVLGLAVLERDHGDAPAFAVREYTGWLRTLRDLWSGNLLFGACVAEASLLGFVAFDLLGERVPAFRRFAASGEMTRGLSRLGWLVIPLLVVLPLSVMVARDAVRFLDRWRHRARFGWLVPKRGSLAATGGIVAGFALATAYYPALAAQLSPQESFETFTRLARPGEELGMVGRSAAAAPYAAGRSVATFATPERAFDWLMEGGPTRRWLVVRSDALGGMNSRYRGRVEPRRNLPVLDGRSSEILLASDRLVPGEVNQNPLERSLPSVEPKPAHPLDANLGDQLDVLGWDLFDSRGRPIDGIVPGETVELVIYYRVVARVTTNWETFVHIDGFQRRFNADHPTLGGRYPFSLWRIGDVVADRHSFALEPNFTPGQYRLFFGLYSGTRRLALRRGEGADDRIDAGPLRVR